MSHRLAFLSLLCVLICTCMSKLKKCWLIYFSCFRTEADGKWEYYSLECLLYFLKNIKRSHPDYVKQAKGQVPIVHRPDRRDLTAYLTGQVDKKDLKSIDHSAPLQMSSNFKRTAEEKLEGSGAKKARVDPNEFKERLAAKLDAQPQGKISIDKANLKNLSKDLTTDKIAQIRAKLLSNRRTRIKAEDDESKAPTLGLGDLEVNKESNEILNRERVWRTRTTILQSTGKTFNKTVMATLNSIKAREEGKLGGGSKPMVPPTSAPRPGVMSQQRQLPNYNRYDQEQFRNKADTHGFNIDTKQTFSGMTLKSVTEGNQAPGRGKPNHMLHGQRGGQTPSGNTPNVGSGTPKTGGQSPGGGASGKRPSRTPIIIIPSAPKSMITMHNAKDILQDLKFVSTDEKKAQGARRENEILIQRRKDGGLTVPYRVIDNPGKLTNADWDRVVAVFVLGQAWQFKGWPWDGNPTVIFSKSKLL